MIHVINYDTSAEGSLIMAYRGQTFETDYNTIRNYDIRM